MFRPTTNFIFFPIVLLIFTLTSVYSDTCYYPERTCTSIYSDWCCSSDETCGTSYRSCDSPSSLSPAVISIIIVAAIFFFVTCLSCCIQSHQRQQQRMRAAYVNTNNRVIANPSQQQIRRGPVRVVHVRPAYNVGAAASSQVYPSMYEAPPPSYEVATADFPSVHQSSSSSPVTATV